MIYEEPESLESCYYFSVICFNTFKIKYDVYHDDTNFAMFTCNNYSLNSCGHIQTEINASANPQQIWSKLDETHCMKVQKWPYFFDVSLTLFLAYYNYGMACPRILNLFNLLVWQRLTSWLVAGALLAELISTNNINNMVSAYLRDFTVVVISMWS